MRQGGDLLGVKAIVGGHPAEPEQAAAIPVRIHPGRWRSAFAPVCASQGMLRGNTLHQAVNRLERRQRPGQVPAADELIGFGEAASYAELPVVYELEPGY